MNPGRSAMLPSDRAYTGISVRPKDPKDKPQPVPPDKGPKPPVEIPPDQPSLPPDDPDPQPKGDPKPNEPTRLV
jgi:hypothetical protein